MISIRSYGFGERRRQYVEHSDPEEAVSLTHAGLPGNFDKHVVDWFGAWPQDTVHPDFPDTANAPAIYNHDGTPYESLMLGFFNVWQGPSNSVAAEHGIQKRNLIAVGYSRDGFHWDRAGTDVFIGDDRTDGAWNWGNIQSVAGGPLIVGDELYFYASGRRKNDDFWDGYTSTGLFSLRRDGFASMRAEGTSGTLTTRVLTFDGQYLFVNADVPESLRVEVLDESGKPIDGYKSLAVKGDSTKLLIEWPGHLLLGDLAGRKIRLRFTLDSGDLFSFWISPWISGESRGATAGGGPGLHPSGWDRPLPSAQ